MQDAPRTPPIQKRSANAINPQGFPRREGKRDVYSLLAMLDEGELDVFQTIAVHLRREGRKSVTPDEYLDLLGEADAGRLDPVTPLSDEEKAHLLVQRLDRLRALAADDVIETSPPGVIEAAVWLSASEDERRKWGTPSGIPRNAAGDGPADRLERRALRFLRRGQRRRQREADNYDRKQLGNLPLHLTTSKRAAERTIADWRWKIGDINAKRAVKREAAKGSRPSA